MNYYSKGFTYLIAFFLIALPLWINKYFGVASVDQLLFTFKFGLKGALTSDPMFIKRFVKWCLIGPSVLTCILLMLETRFSLPRLYNDKQSLQN